MILHFETFGSYKHFSKCEHGIYTELLPILYPSYSKYIVYFCCIDTADWYTNLKVVNASQLNLLHNTVVYVLWRDL